MATLIDKVYSLNIGVQGENIARPIELDMTEWVEAYPDASFYVLFRPYNESEAVPMLSTFEDNILTWTPTLSATAVSGVGYTEVRALDPETGLIRKSRIIPTSVENSVTGADENPPQPYTDWVNRILEAGSDAVKGAAAVAAVSQGEEVAFEIDADGHLNIVYTESGEPQTLDLGPVDAYAIAVVEGYTGTREEWVQAMADAEANGLKAEGYAIGKQNGVAVESGEYYQNNAKYYSEQAQSAKEDAEDAQTAAETAQTAAETAQTSAEASAAEAAQYTSDAVAAWLNQKFGQISADPPLDRTLSQALAAAPADMVGDLKSALLDTEGYIEYVNGKYISFGTTIGETANLTPSSNSSFRYAIVDCSPGDQFILSGQGASSTRLWGFIDSDDKILAVSASNANITDQILTAPANASKLIINDKSGRNTYKGILPKKKTEELQKMDDSIVRSLNPIAIEYNTPFISSDFIFCDSANQSVVVTDNSIDLTTNNAESNLYSGVFVKRTYLSIDTNALVVIARKIPAFASSGNYYMLVFNTYDGKLYTISAKTTYIYEFDNVLNVGNDWNHAGDILLLGNGLVSATLHGATNIINITDYNIRADRDDLGKWSVDDACIGFSYLGATKTIGYSVKEHYGEELLICAGYKNNILKGKEWEEGKYINGSGVETYSESAMCTGYIQAEQFKKHLLIIKNKNGVGVKTASVAAYDANYNFISRPVVLSTTTRIGGLYYIEFTTPINTAYIRVSSAISDYFIDTMLFEKSGTGGWWKRRKWVAIGDSITYGTHSNESGDPAFTRDPKTGWAAVCSELIGHNLINLSVPGMGFVHPAPTPLAEDADLIDVLTNHDDAYTDAELVTVMLGTNDYGHDQPIGTMSDTSATVSIYGRIKLIIETIKTKCPSARLVFISPILRTTNSSISTHYNKGKNNTATPPYNLTDVKNAIIDVCNYYDLEYINVLDNFAINCWNWRIYLYDKLHPSIEGHALIGGIMANKLIY